MDRRYSDLTFLEHLEELRFRIIKVIVAVTVCACLVYFFIEPILAFITRPVGKLIFTSPEEAFLARMTLTIFGGFFLALPVILSQFWQFVARGLLEHERRYVRIFGPLSLVCFLSGLLFGYFVVVPMSLYFLLGFKTAQMVPMITVDKYISFVGTLVLAGGVIFELPLVIIFLAKLGIASPEFLRQKRRYAIVIILIISAVITPPDVVSQLLMAAPLLILYEAGIWGAEFVSRSKK